MQHIASIDINTPSKQEKRKSYTPADVDKVKNWHKILRQVYPMRELDEYGYTVWTSVIGHCDNKTMLGVIKDWIVNNDKAPKPSNLLTEYKYITKPVQKIRGPQIVNGEEVYNCKYCHDFGYFRAYDGDVEKHGRMADQVMYPCSCSPHEGNLYKALHDDMWFWSDEFFGFIKKTGWVGDYANADTGY
jgi:hypothetical protein